MDPNLRRRLHGLLLVLALVAYPGAGASGRAAAAAKPGLDAAAGQPSGPPGSDEVPSFESAPLGPAPAARFDEGRRNPPPDAGARLHPAEWAVRLRVAPCAPPPETTAAGPLARWCLSHSTGTASP